jgi:hypothetical protein
MRLKNRHLEAPACFFLSPSPAQSPSHMCQTRLLLGAVVL